MELIGKIDLRKFIGSREMEISGEDGIFIPYMKNPSIYRSSRCAYAGIIVRAKRNVEYGQTHFVVLNPSLEQAKVLSTSEIRKVCPIIGNLSPVATSATANPLQGVGSKIVGDMAKPWSSNPIISAGEEIAKSGKKAWDTIIEDETPAPPQSDEFDDIPF